MSGYSRQEVPSDRVEGQGENAARLWASLFDPPARPKTVLPGAREVDGYSDSVMKDLNDSNNVLGQGHRKQDKPDKVAEQARKSSARVETAEASARGPQLAEPRKHTALDFEGVVGRRAASDKTSLHVDSGHFPESGERVVNRGAGDLVIGI